MVATIERPRILERLANAGKPTKATKAKRNGIDKRVEMLGKLNDRYMDAIGAGDKAALLEIAGEYMLLGNHGGCPNLANRILLDAEGL